ncbi:MAG TPA: SusE domain-containing protein [Chitinophagaceae bacterium]|nr:SusE domain-containing protein [Chitinophagaceae bacterium]
MKHLITKFFTLALGISLMLGACKKDDVLLETNKGKDPLLTASTNSLVLLQANKDNEAISFSWSKQFWGVNTANVVYTLQMIKEGGDWEDPEVEVSNGELLTKKFTVGEFNRELLRFLDPQTTSDVLVRVKSEVPNSAAISHSNAVKITATTYRDIILYTWPAAINIAGNFQGWSPSTAPQIVNTKNGGYTGHEGYIIFNNGTPEFKMVKGNDWGAGDYGSAGPGTLGNGGPNLTLPSGGAGLNGLYRIRANVSNLTWSYDKIDTWGIIGSFNGWGASLPMTMDANGNFSVTTDFPANTEFKFRANNDWAINFGDATPANFEPEYGSDNIKVAAAGNYTIKLNIGVAGNYNYSLKKN